MATPTSYKRPTGRTCEAAPLLGRVGQRLLLEAKLAGKEAAIEQELDKMDFRYACVSVWCYLNPCGT